MPTRVARLASMRPSSRATQPRKTAEFSKGCVSAHGIPYRPRSARPLTTLIGKNSARAQWSLTIGLTSDSIHGAQAHQDVLLAVGELGLHAVEVARDGREGAGGGHSHAASLRLGARAAQRRLVLWCKPVCDPGAPLVGRAQFRSEPPGESPECSSESPTHRAITPGGRRPRSRSCSGVAPTGAPQAELWLGAHPGSPSRLVGREGTLADLVPGRLPFLLKVLAAGAPLSLQAHPTPAQAEAGFARENAAGVPLDAPERNYKDAFHKPELIYALSDPFTALSGFRPVADTLAVLEPVAGDARLEPLRIAARRRRLAARRVHLADLARRRRRGRHLGRRRGRRGRRRAIVGDRAPAGRVLPGRPRHPDLAAAAHHRAAARRGAVPAGRQHPRVSGRARHRADGRERQRAARRAHAEARRRARAARGARLPPAAGAVSAGPRWSRRASRCSAPMCPTSC